MKKQMHIDDYLGEEKVEHLGKLNEIKTHITKRKDGTVRIQQDFVNCPTMAEQHTAHLSDLNYLIEKYKPDELAAYLAARNQHRQEILGHDFSEEPSLQDARSLVYQSRKAFNELPDDIRLQFKNHVEFLKFIDNPANAERMLKLGLLEKKQLEAIKIEEPGNTLTPPLTPTTNEVTKEKSKEK